MKLSAASNWRLVHACMQQQGVFELHPQLNRHGSPWGVLPAFVLFLYCCRKLVHMRVSRVYTRKSLSCFSFFLLVGRLQAGLYHVMQSCNSYIYIYIWLCSLMQLCSTINPVNRSSNARIMISTQERTNNNIHKYKNHSIYTYMYDNITFTHKNNIHTSKKIKMHTYDSWYAPQRKLSQITEDADKLIPWGNPANSRRRRGRRRSSRGCCSRWRRCQLLRRWKSARSTWFGGHARRGRHHGGLRWFGAQKRTGKRALTLCGRARHFGRWPVWCACKPAARGCTGGRLAVETMILCVRSACADVGGGSHAILT